MKKIIYYIMITICFSIIISSCASTTQGDDVEDELNISETSTDKYDIATEIQDIIDDWGNVTWDSTLNSYVITPRNSLRKLIISLAAEPSNDKYLEIWDESANIIAEISEMYSCCICVANPANTNNILLIVGYGDVVKSYF